jgi:hypothetical protein
MELHTDLPTDLSCTVISTSRLCCVFVHGLRTNGKFFPGQKSLEDIADNLREARFWPTNNKVECSVPTSTLIDVYIRMIASFTNRAEWLFSSQLNT